jgi:hypothetical protein
VDEELIYSLTTYQEMGFKIALDDFVFSESLIPLLEVADLIKIDFLITKGSKRQELVNKCLEYNSELKFLGEKIENYQDYEIAKNIGRIGIDSIDAPFIGDYNDYFNNYFLALDTGITDNLSMRLSYDYAPIRDDSDYELDNQVYTAYFNYSMKNDKSLYFGYNKLKSDGNDKQYPLGNEDLDIDYYFIGFEKRGSFLGKNN